jgi:hemolysin activation/secretion protein
MPSPATDAILVRQFQVVGSTVFSCEDLEAALASYFNQALTFVQLLEARSTITQLYLEADYITSGAYLPGEQRLDESGAVVLIQVIEGRVADIRVRGTERLSPAYVRSRLQRGIGTPLNQNELLDALRLIQVNPLIASVAAELSSGIKPGTNVLEVQITEADPLSAQIVSNNGRSPSVGSFRRGARLTHANVFGLGDGLSIGYNNTQGSNSLDINYTIPWNSLDGTISLNYGRERNTVIEPSFDDFEIETDANYYQIALRQPLVRTPTEEFALSLIAAHTDSQSTLDGQPTPLSPGADGTGRTRITALRFAQDWVTQNQRTVLAARSQLQRRYQCLECNGERTSTR